MLVSGMAGQVSSEDGESQDSDGSGNSIYNCYSPNIINIVSNENSTLKAKHSLLQLLRASSKQFEACGDTPSTVLINPRKSLSFPSFTGSFPLSLASKNESKRIYSASKLTPKESTGAFYLLPDEIRLAIMCLLSEKEIKNFFLLNKYWHSLSEDPSVWKSLYFQAFLPQRDFPPLSKGGIYSWKEQFVRRCRIRSNWFHNPPPPVFRQTSHNGLLTACALQGDDLFLATDASEHNLQVWSTQNGGLLKSFAGSNDGCTCIDLSEDYVIAGSWDKSIRVWSRTTGELSTCLVAHTRSITCLQLGQFRGQLRLLTGSYDKTGRIWDLASGQCLAVLAGHNLPILSCAFSPHADLAVTGSRDRTIRVWRPDSDVNGQLTWLCHGILKGHQAEVSTLAVTRLGNHLFSGSSDGSVRLWNLSTFECLQIVLGPEATPVSCLQLGQDLLIVGYCNGEVRIYSFHPSSTGQFIRHLYNLTIPLGSASKMFGVTSLFLEESRLVVAFSDRSLYIYDYAL